MRRNLREQVETMAMGAAGFVFAILLFGCTGTEKAEVFSRTDVLRLQEGNWERQEISDYKFTLEVLHWDSGFSDRMPLRIEVRQGSVASIIDSGGLLIWSEEIGDSLPVSTSHSFGRELFEFAEQIKRLAGSSSEGSNLAEGDPTGPPTPDAALLEFISPFVSIDRLFDEVGFVLQSRILDHRSPEEGPDPFVGVEIRYDPTFGFPTLIEEGLPPFSNLRWVTVSEFEPLD